MDEEFRVFIRLLDRLDLTDYAWRGEYLVNTLMTELARRWRRAHPDGKSPALDLAAETAERYYRRACRMREEVRDELEQ
jgi:hypothetical protein